MPVRITAPDPRPGFKHVAHVVSRTLRAVGEIEHRRNLNMHRQFKGQRHTLAPPKSPSKNISDSHDRRK